MVNKRFSRTALIFGEEGMAKLHNSKIAIVGLGGVGSFAAEMLARSGIGALILVDFDRVGLTNINRQITALTSTVGQLKVDVLTSRLKDINPDIDIVRAPIFCGDDGRDILLSEADYIIDAIDSLNPKAGLLEYAHKSKIKVISCMGAANRLNPSLIRLDDISRTTTCPLASRVRKYLNKRGIYEGIPVVYSIEKPLALHTYDTLEDETLERGRKRSSLGSVAHLPAAFASWAVSYVLKDIVS
jgi:tRNA A37 threonylcarbamoyladenosine dehydratase